MDFCIYRCRDFNVVNLKFGPAEIGSSCVRSRYSVGFVGFCFLPCGSLLALSAPLSPTWVLHTLICDLKPTSNVTILLWSWEDRTLVIYSPVIDYCILQREEEEKGRTWAERSDLTWQSLSLVILSSLQILVILFFFPPSWSLSPLFYLPLRGLSLSTLAL